ncbi:MAG: hypothetical protein LC114_14665 [Bryobacterales bacterium]|nr:hypothetical protein [Bryobacterales bacterium]
MGIFYVIIGALLLLWGVFQLRRGFKPFRLRPFLLIILGALMAYTGLRLEQFLP